LPEIRLTGNSCWLLVAGFLLLAAGGWRLLVARWVWRTRWGGPPGPLPTPTSASRTAGPGGPAQGVRPTRLSSIRDEALGRHEASDYMSSCARVANPRSSAPLGGGRGKNISSTGSIEDAGPRLLIPRGRLSAPVPSLTRGYNSVGGPAGARNSGDLVFLQPLAIGAQAANRLTTSHSNANPLVP
jgi:hypothetical protein